MAAGDGWEHLSTVIVGGSQSGLAVGYHQTTESMSSSSSTGFV